MLELHIERPLSGTERPNVPYFFVGDERFALNRNILRPFGGSDLSVKKREYNYCLCRTRRYAECAFGNLSNKWRIFQRPLNVSPDFEVVIDKASAVLQNFVRGRYAYAFLCLSGDNRNLPAGQKPGRVNECEPQSFP